MPPCSQRTTPAADGADGSVTKEQVSRDVELVISILRGVSALAKVRLFFSHVACTLRHQITAREFLGSHDTHDTRLQLFDHAALQKRCA